VYASLNSDIVELYDLELNPLVRICGPKKPEIRYVVSNEDNKFDKMIPYAYIDVSVTSDFIYASYSGYVLRKDEHSHDIYLDKGYIMKFTWDGELAGCYSVDRLPYSIYVRDDKTMYVTMKDDREARALYSCQLP